MSSTAPKLTHLDQQGRARMVDVSAKALTRRSATATGKIRVLPATIRAIARDETPKGDVLAVARIAGVMAAKKTHELIPLCHPLMLDSIEVDFDFPDIDKVSDDSNPIAVDLSIKAIVSLSGKTGVEMEALTAVTVAALTLYDMCKAIDHQMVIHGIHLIEKTK